jgi:hypothetical protein
MFIGHAAAGFAAKRWAPRASLAWLLAAPWLLDLLWPVFLLLGTEKVTPQASASPFLSMAFTSYPWSHSLVMALFWSVVAGAAYGRVTRDRAGALVIGALVASHWLLDLIVHVPDLPLWPGRSPLLGLALWRLPALTMFVEGVLFVGGLALYVSATRPRDRTGNLALAALVAALLGLYWASLSGGPPPSTQAVAWTMLAFGAAIVPWAAWIERHRRSATHEDD